MMSLHDEQAPAPVGEDERQLWLVLEPRRSPAPGSARGSRPVDGARKVRLAPLQLYHPAGPCELLVRRGRIRLSEVLDDGREVARDVAQSGFVLRIVPGSPARGRAFPLPRTILMALGESELWELPPGQTRSRDDDT